MPLAALGVPASAGPMLNQHGSVSLVQKSSCNSPWRTPQSGHASTIWRTARSSGFGAERSFLIASNTLEPCSRSASSYGNRPPRRVQRESGIESSATWSRNVGPASGIEVRRGRLITGSDAETHTLSAPHSDRCGRQRESAHEWVDPAARARCRFAMNAVEFTTELSGSGVLQIPSEAAAQLPKSGTARVIVLTREDGEDAEWRRGAYQQFLRDVSTGL